MRVMTQGHFSARDDDAPRDQQHVPAQQQPIGGAQYAMNKTQVHYPYNYQDAGGVYVQHYPGNNMPVNMGQQWTQPPPAMNPNATPFQTRQNQAAN